MRIDSLSIPRLLMCGVFILIGGSSDATQEKKTSQQQESPDSVVERQRQRLKDLFDCKSYPKLLELVGKWKRDLPDVEQKLQILALLRRFDSVTALALDEKEKIYILSDGERNSSTATLPDAALGKYLVSHDPLTEGGRAAWAVEKLLSCRLPVVRAGMGEEMRKMLREQAYEDVIGAMWLPDVTVLSGGEENLVERLQLKFARNNNTDVGALLILSESKFAPVRKAVAQHPRTPSGTLGRLLRDPDPQVRAGRSEKLNGFVAYFSTSDVSTGPNSLEQLHVPSRSRGYAASADELLASVLSPGW